MGNKKRRKPRLSVKLMRKRISRYANAVRFQKIQQNRSDADEHSAKASETSPVAQSSADTETYLTTPIRFENDNDDVCTSTPNVILSTEPEPRSKWLEVIGRPDLMSIQTKPKSHTVCSLHFDKTMIKNLPQLKSDAVPTISLPNAPSTSDINTNANCKDVSTQTEEAFIEIFSTVSIKRPGSKSSRGQTASSNDMDKTTQTSHTLLPTTPIKHKLQGAELGSGGCICKFCQREIIGFRYTCVQCEDVELCSACEAKDRHCLHYVLRIPESRPQEEVERVLCRIRHELKAGLQPVAAKGANDSDKTDDTDKADNTHDPADTVNADTVNADSVKVEVKEEPDPGPDPLQDSSLNTAYDLELTSELDIKIEKEWLDEEIKEEMKEENFAVFTHSAVEATRDKIPQKRPSHNITTIPEKKPYFSIESNASSCSGSGVHIDKNLKLLTKPPLRLNESSNFEIHKHASGGQINKATLPQGNEEGSSVKKKNN